MQTVLITLKDRILELTSQTINFKTHSLDSIINSFNHKTHLKILKDLRLEGSLFFPNLLHYTANALSKITKKVDHLKNFT